MYQFNYRLTQRREKFIGLFIFLTVCNSMLAQQNKNQFNKKWVFNIGVVLSSSSVIDKAFSIVPYSGNNWGGTTSLKYQNKKVSQELGIYFSKGILKTSVAPAVSLNNTYFNVDYTNLRQLSSNNKQLISCKVGGSIAILYADRQYKNFINNNASFDFAASLGATVEVSYAFKNKLTGFVISDKINIPFVSAVVQPSFGSYNPSGVLNQNNIAAKDFFKNGRILSFSNFLRFKNLLSIEKNITLSQKISFNYTWDYYSILSAREIKQSYHQLGLTYSFVF